MRLIPGFIFFLMMTLIVSTNTISVHGCSIAGPARITSDLHIYDFNGNQVVDENLKDSTLSADCGFRGRIYPGSAESFVIEDPYDTYKVGIITSDGLEYQTIDSVPEETETGEMISMNADHALYGESSRHRIEDVFENNNSKLTYEFYNIEASNSVYKEIDLSAFISTPWNFENDSMEFNHDVEFHQTGGEFILVIEEDIFDKYEDDYTTNNYVYSSITENITTIDDSLDIRVFDPQFNQIIYDSESRQMTLFDLNTLETNTLNIDPINSFDVFLRGEKLVMADLGSSFDIYDLDDMSHSNITIEMDQFVLTENYIVGGYTSINAYQSLLLYGIGAVAIIGIGILILRRIL